MKFNLYKRVEVPSDVNPSCMWIDTLILLQNDLLYDFGKRSPLEQCLTNLITTTELDCEDLSSILELIETILALEVNDKELVLEEEKKTSDGLVLKELPKGLKYAFLGSIDTKPVIISLEMGNDMEIKLLDVLGKDLEAFSWSIDDIKGISPFICMHKILMEEEHVPFIEHQRRLNPAMKQVVKKEVLKWLKVGFIYAISDSSWVSPVQVVPKRGGMTVVQNEKYELLSTRIVIGWRVRIDYRKLNKATWKDHYPLPFLG